MFWRRAKKEERKRESPDVPGAFYALVESKSPPDTRISDVSTAVTGLNTLLLIETGFRPLLRTANEDELQDGELIIIASMYLTAIDLRAFEVLEPDAESEQRRDDILKALLIPVQLNFPRLDEQVRNRMITAGLFFGLELVKAVESNEDAQAWINAAWKAVDAAVILGKEEGFAALVELYRLMPLFSSQSQESAG